MAIIHKHEMRQRCGRIMKQPIQQTDFLRQGERAQTGGAHKREINRERIEGGSENEET